MVDFARNHDFLVVSPFSTMNLFAYQTWAPALDAESSTEARQSFDQLVMAALASGQLSPVGAAFSKLASS